MRVAASARSASAQTMLAALEPSSPTNFFAPAARASSLPAGRAAGHRDDRDQRMGGEQLCRGVASARHDVEQAVGHARLLEHRLGDQQRAPRVPGGDGLTTTALPTASAGATFWISRLAGAVERRDRGDHAVGHARGEAEAAGAGGGHVERQHLAREVRHLRRRRRA